MTENEAIEVLNVFNEKRKEFVKERISTRPDYFDEKTYRNFTKSIEMSVKALEEIQQYRSIGTVSECREAVEKQRAKKPERFYKKYGKHKWKRTADGEIDEFAFDADRHSGVVCEICGEAVCTMCNPDYDELDDCEEEYDICPNCGNKYLLKAKHCNKCGQAISWKED